MVKTVQEVMKEQRKERASLDCVPINRCEQQSLQVWQNTIDWILKE